MLLKKNKIFPLVLCGFMAVFAACASSGKKPDNGVNFIPSLERALEIMGQTKGGHELADYLWDHPVPVTYAQLAGPWPKYDPVIKQIFLPRDIKENDYLVMLALARAIEVYRICDTLGLDEIIVETEQIAALGEMELAIEVGLKEREGEDSLPGQKLLDEFCSFMVEGADGLTDKVRGDCLALHPEYNRPYKSVDAYEKWLRQTKEALDGGTLNQLMLKRDRDLVRRGEITTADADKNASAFASLEPRQIYRQYNDMYIQGMEKMGRLKRLYQKRISRDKSWRKKNEAAISRQLSRTRYCGTFVRVEDYHVPGQD
ncbi:MAG: hypothetical protein PHW69_05420 [Elusimicrobiaceae bacterium]|nr:hypothetical protein [Elusimicrobiaceae bacterium]